MADTEKKWYVLRAVSGKEAKVKEYIDAQLRLNAKLAERVFEVLLPMEKHATLRNGKRVVKEKFRRTPIRRIFSECLKRMCRWCSWLIQIILL